MRSHSHSDNDKTQLFGIAALAACIGAATAVLFARQSGSETRQTLRGKFRDAKSKPQAIKKEINEAADNAKDIALRAKDGASSKTTEVADMVADKIDKIKKS